MLMEVISIVSEWNPFDVSASVCVLEFEYSKKDANSHNALG